MVQVDASSKFSDLRPIRSDPPLYHLCGFGLYLYGERDFRPGDGELCPDTLLLRDVHPDFRLASVPRGADGRRRR